MTAPTSAGYGDPDGTTAELAPAELTGTMPTAAVPSGVTPTGAELFAAEPPVVAEPFTPRPTEGEPTAVGPTPAERDAPEPFTPQPTPAAQPPVGGPTALERIAAEPTAPQPLAAQPLAADVGTTGGSDADPARSATGEPGGAAGIDATGDLRGGIAPAGDTAAGPVGTAPVGGPAPGAAASGDDSPEAEEAEPAETAVGAPVRRPDQGARRDAVARVEELAVPLGGLGNLAELGCWLAACQGECPPRPPIQARVLLVAADHGVAEAGLSAYPPEAGRSRAVAAADGRLPVAVAARAAGASVRVVDVGLLDPAGPDEEHVVTRGTGRIDREDALSEEQAERAYRIGQLLADAEIDTGADVLVPGSLAVAATTPAAVLVAALTGAEPVAVVGRGSGIDDRTWMRKAVVIRDALRRGRPYVRTPLDLLRRVGGTDIIVLAGLLARAADRRVPVVLDGLAVGAAALLAEELAPGAREWWLAAQASSEPAMTLVLEHLSLSPVLDLGIRTDDGTAAVAVLPLLVTAARLIAETGTSADTGIAPLPAE